MGWLIQYRVWCRIEMCARWGNEGVQAGRQAENELTWRQFVSMPWEWHTAWQWRHRLQGWRRGRGRAHPPPRHSTPPPSRPGNPKEVKHNMNTNENGKCTVCSFQLTPNRRVWIQKVRWRWMRKHLGHWRVWSLGRHTHTLHSFCAHYSCKPHCSNKQYEYIRVRRMQENRERGVDLVKFQIFCLLCFSLLCSQLRF